MFKGANGSGVKHLDFKEGAILFFRFPVVPLTASDPVVPSWMDEGKYLKVPTCLARDNIDYFLICTCIND